MTIETARLKVVSDGNGGTPGIVPKMFDCNNSNRYSTCFSTATLVMHKIFGLILTSCVCAAAPAATLRQLTLDQMAQDATAIVRGRVTASSASFAGTTIYTHYKLQVSEVWKGSGATEVMLPGGVAGGYRQSFPGVPVLNTGAEYVLFLWRSGSTGITHLVGLTQGLFSVTTQTDGSALVSRPRIGETMLDLSGHEAKDQAVRMNLGAMKTRVRRTAAGVSK
jgi:hypothetical protein